MEEVLSASSERTKDESPESDVCSYADTMSSSASPAPSASLADRAPRGTLTPGTLSPERHVPASIERPEYMFHDGPERVTASEIKDAETIERIRVASRLAARALAEAAKAIAPEVTTDELDRIAHEYLCDHGAYPSCLGYMGFPKSICTSINEVICHGIPDSTRLNEGDLINLDVTAYIGGVHGDTNATYAVGEVDPETELLIDRTRTAMERGIKAVKPGREVNVIGRVIEAYAKRFDYGVVRDYTGHGVGEAFHSGLIIPHYDAAPFTTTSSRPAWCSPSSRCSRSAASTGSSGTMAGRWSPRTAPVLLSSSTPWWSLTTGPRSSHFPEPSGCRAELPIRKCPILCSSTSVHVA